VTFGANTMFDKLLIALWRPHFRDFILNVDS
jgi:hypothetical protein